MEWYLCKVARINQSDRLLGEDYVHAFAETAQALIEVMKRECLTEVEALVGYRRMGSEAEYSSLFGEDEVPSLRISEHRVGGFTVAEHMLGMGAMTACYHVGELPCG